jgi:hypothetical protein
MRSFKPSIPDATPIDLVLRQSSMLSILTDRLRLSAARLEAIRVVVPAPLQKTLKAGPLDEDSWTLLVGNPAIGAKLRQFLPRIQEQLHQTGWPEVLIQIHVHVPTKR